MLIDYMHDHSFYRGRNEESLAIYMHCYGHALNLAVSGCMKSSKICKDALDAAFEITRLIKFSPKRNAAFDRI